MFRYNKYKMWWKNIWQ